MKRNTGNREDRVKEYGNSFSNKLVPALHQKTWDAHNLSIAEPIKHPGNEGKYDYRNWYGFN